jgi:metallophosphoesterase superfamily enzyme
MTLRSSSGDRARVPAFWFSDTQVILPAFGVFTGGFSIRPERTDRIFVIAGQEVLAINPV